MVIKSVDILIIGGGLTGACLSLALKDKGYECLLVDAHRQSAKLTSDFDARCLALSPASIRILKMLAIWPLLQAKASTINWIHVSDQSYFGATRLFNKANEPLGYVVEVQEINAVLHQLLDAQMILAPAQLIALQEHNATLALENGTKIKVQAKLIVAADGGESTVRRLSGLVAHSTHYQQRAIVTTLGLNRSHQNKAYERFTEFGPLAVLPMTQNRVSLVWALPPHEATRLIRLSDLEFLAILQRTFGYRLGRFQRVGKRTIFPLQQIIMPKNTAWPLVFVGNAAHTLHPVAGQGFNLGLRDVAALAQCISEHGLNEAMLARYQAMRSFDQTMVTRLTDGLIRVFTSSVPGLNVARNLGLIAVDTIPALKKLLMRYAGGFAGILPDLICHIPLNGKEKNES